MSNKIITIRLSTSTDDEAIGDFRVEQYKTANEFQMMDFLPIRKIEGDNIIVEVDNKIISTMQFKIANTLEEIYILNHYNLPGLSSEKVLLPSLFLNRGATSYEYRKFGLNSLLRKVVLQKYLNSNIQSFSGVVYEGASRTNIVKRIGYNFFELEGENDPNFKTVVKTFYIQLQRNKFSSAISLLEEDLKEIYTNFKIINKVN